MKPEALPKDLSQYTATQSATQWAKELYSQQPCSDDKNPPLIPTEWTWILSLISHWPSNDNSSEKLWICVRDPSWERSDSHLD